MNIKTFTLMFIVIYLVLSLPSMLGIGYVIDWIPQASLSQRIRGYVMEGLANGFQFKIIISAIVSVGLISLLSEYRVKKSLR
ncbi:hypothetical protein [Exiguobacterium chiriqhucha]|uniref:Uncharacterized protein n=1 Tax=Exiguobacterium chiriqhucha RW-2 TaxID=1345023 RepID=U1LVW1_9BACL|nr:hypothetical protein [Exiguobacterium chiriqhucha]ERG66749.1 hypothetical protein M467_05595 [Exiguobacterium chiriqhucha RW-2]